MDVTITNAGGRIEIIDLRNGLTNSYDVLKDGLRLFNLGDIVRITFVNRRNIEIDYTEVELINGATSIIPVSGVDFLNELNVLLGDFGTGGGPGDVPTLQEVTDEGNTTDNDISFTNAGLLFDNGAKFKKGTTDGGLGGAKGVAQICSIDYELKWEAGRLYVMEQNGFTIREVRYTFTSIPNEFDDITKGYVVGSRWVLDNGNVYICSDNTLDNAVWALETIGGGDMFKAVYDTDNDGNVDKAETVQIIVRNSTGVTLTKGQIVYLSGATGNRPNAVLSQANAEATSSKTIGWVPVNIPNNSDGFVAVSGSDHNLNTSAFTAGDALWLSPTVAGGMTATKPTQPDHAVFIGYCARSHPTQGRIVFKIQNGYELQDLHNILITSVANNQGLYYEDSSQLWKNKNFEDVLTITNTGSNGAATLVSNTLNIPDYNTSATSSAFYGDGFDGVINLNGTNTYTAFISKVGSAYTLLRNIFPSSFTIASGVTLNTAGYQITCNGTSTINGTMGSSGNNGGNAVFVSGGYSTAGAGAVSLKPNLTFSDQLFVPFNTAAGNGNNGAGGWGAAGGSIAVTWYFYGALGGGGGAGRNAAGVLQTGSSVTITTGKFQPCSGFNLGINNAFGLVATGGVYISAPGGGGGAGANFGGGWGGAGGGGGGCPFGVKLISNTIIISATGLIISNGGNGGNGSTGSGNFIAGSGGGGGGGGIVYLVTNGLTYTPNNRIQAKGGAGGAGGGVGGGTGAIYTALPGSNGTDGYIHIFNTFSGTSVFYTGQY
jgi:hypothetical protein